MITSKIETARRPSKDWMRCIVSGVYHYFLLADSDDAPVRWVGIYFNLGKSRGLHHGDDLGGGEALFQSGSEAVERVVAHDVEAAIAIERERELFHVRQLFDQAREPGQRPVDEGRDHVGDETLQREGT